MKRYRSLAEDRKKLVRKLETITGRKASYTKVPRCAYQVGSFFVERDGSFTDENEAGSEEILSTLQAEGFIGEELPLLPRGKVHIIRKAKPQADLESQPEGVTQTLNPETSVQRAEERISSEFPNLPILPAIHFPENEEVLQPEEHEEEAEESTGQQDDTERQQEEAIPDLGEEPETEESSSQEPMEEELDAPALEEPVPDEDTVFSQNQFSISFPIAKHTGSSLINLLNTLYSRGPLISKATCGNFSCDQAFIEELVQETSLHNTEQVKEFINHYEAQHGSAFQGLSFEEDQITWTGFTTIPDADHLQSFMILAEKINRMCLLQKRVQAKKVDDSNERYALRTWLNRLDMKGIEYKQVRKHLLEHLTGHSAFRTREEEERAKQKALKNRNNG